MTAPSDEVSEESTPLPLYVWTDYEEVSEDFHVVRVELEVWAGEELLYESGPVSVDGLVVQAKLFR